MNNMNEKINVESIEKNDKHLIENMYRFLQTCLIEHIYFLIIALRQMFFETKDISPIVAGISTGLSIFTIYHLVKIRKYIAENKKQ